MNEAWNDYTGENNSYGDFTNVMEPGEYYVRAQIGVVSHPFVIEENPYIDFTNSVIRMLSLQRCGHNNNESWAHELAHPECHTSVARVYQTEVLKMYLEDGTMQVIMAAISRPVQKQ